MKVVGLGDQIGRPNILTKMHLSINNFLHNSSSYTISMMPNNTAKAHRARREREQIERSTNTLPDNSSYITGVNTSGISRRYVAQRLRRERERMQTVSSSNTTNNDIPTASLLLPKRPREPILMYSISSSSSSVNNLEDFNSLLRSRETIQDGCIV